VRVLARGRIAQWSKDKIAAFSTPELRQLLANAERLEETDVATMCRELLDARPRGHAVVRKPRPKSAAGRRLVARNKAFEMHGATPSNRYWSRSGVRPADGMVILNLWAADVRTEQGICSCLLWAPNLDGSRPWSDKPGGQERLAHCGLALERGIAQGLLVYGEALEGSLPEDKALSVDGVDAENVVDMKIEKRGKEFWATWHEVRRMPEKRAR
jgi:hypothetical protein